MVIAGVGLVGNLSQCRRRRRGLVVWQRRIRAAMAMKAVVMVMVIAMASENLVGKTFSSFFSFFFSFWLVGILDPQWHIGPH